MALKYDQLLRDPRWQKKRLLILQRDNFTCVLCEDCRTTLAVHHEKYKGNPWDIEDKHLKTVCIHCHAVIHALPKHNIIDVHKRFSINSKCFEIVAYTPDDFVYLYLFPKDETIETIVIYSTLKNAA